MYVKYRMQALTRERLMELVSEERQSCLTREAVNEYLTGWIQTTLYELQDALVYAAMKGDTAYCVYTRTFVNTACSGAAHKGWITADVDPLPALRAAVGSGIRVEDACKQYGAHTEDVVLCYTFRWDNTSHSSGGGIYSYSDEEW